MSQKIEKKEEKLVFFGGIFTCTKKEYDNFWNKIFYGCLILTGIGLFFLVIGISEFRRKLIELEPNYEFSKFSDFKICIPFMIFFLVLKHFALEFLKKVCEKVMKKNYRFPKTERDEALGKRYRVILPMHAYKGTMYFIFTVAGYIILKDLDYFPKTLLGHGYLPNMFKDGYPQSMYLKKPPLFDLYYLCCLAYFSSDFIFLVLNDKQTDFINMLLHHICTISLIVFSYLTNYSNVGSIVLLLHNETDILVHLTRFLLQTDFPEIFKNISGVTLVFNFIYMRVYVLGEIIYVLYNYVTWKGAVEWFLLIFLVIIYLMHINWSIMLLQKMFALITGTKLNDTRECKINEKSEKSKELKEKSQKQC